MAVIITSTLVLVTYALSNISLKELLLSYLGKDSQVAFYAADVGVECAIFWDTKNPRSNDGISAFSETQANPKGINCNSHEVVHGESPVYTVPTPTTAVLGGGPDSIFQFFINENPDDAGPCAVVRVHKEPHETIQNVTVTTIESRGYNTCDVNNSRRLERALRTVY